MPLWFLEYNIVSFINEKCDKSEFCSCVLVQKNQQGINKDNKGSLESFDNEAEFWLHFTYINYGEQL